MSQYATLIGILGLAAIAACWALAIVLYRVGPPGSLARKLSLLLIVESLTLATAGFPEMALGVDWSFLDANPAYAMALNILHHLADAGMIALYPPFLAAALQTNLTRPFERGGVRIAIAVVAVSLAIGTVISMAVWDSLFGSGLLYFTMMALFVFALVAAFFAWRAAKPGVARTRAGVFAVAFGIRDVSWGFVYGASFWMASSNSWSLESDLFWLVKLVYALGTLIAIPLIAYGILRGHLFDIDLRIRWTIKQSTLAALIVAIIFLISEGANTFLSEELGTVAGLLAAAVLIFFLAPLQQFAERVAASAMPNTENTPEYVAFRKMQVYENALAEALEEGGISPKERSLLNRLRESLEISETDAQAIEAELQGRVATTY